MPRLSLSLIREHPGVGVSAVVVVGLLVWGLWPQPVMIESARVSRGPLTVSIEEEGRTRVIDRYVISAPVDGVACRVDLNVGDPVKVGEVLLGISPMQSQTLDARTRAEAEARRDAAQSSLRAAKEKVASAQETADLAARELERVAPLLEKKMVSPDVYDRARTSANAAAAELRSARFQVEVAEYEAAAARSTLEFAGQASTSGRVPVESPIDGRILKVAHECEGPVRTGDPLLEVGDPSALEVEVDVLSADAVRIHEGMAVRFNRWGGEGQLEGVVRTVEPVAFTKVSALGVEEQRVLVIADFVSPAEKWRSLGDGYRVEAEFILWQAGDVLQVPMSALFRHDGGWAVFVISDARAWLRTVEVDHRNGMAAEITGGLDAGTWVINHPGDTIEDGVRVKVRTELDAGS